MVKVNLMMYEMTLFQDIVHLMKLLLNIFENIDMVKILFYRLKLKLKWHLVLYFAFIFLKYKTHKIVASTYSK